MPDVIDQLAKLIDAKRPLVVVSHPRSGTHLTIDFLRNNVRNCGGWKYPFEPHNMVYCSLDALALPKPQLDVLYAIKVLKRSSIPIIKTHSIGPEFNDVRFFGEELKSLPKTLVDSIINSCRFVYVIRDCRNVMASLHHWMSGFSRNASKQTLADFTKQELRGDTRIQQWASHVTNWKCVDNLVIIRFEDLVNNPTATAGRLESHLKIEFSKTPTLPRKTSRIRNKFDRLFSLRPTSTAILGQNASKLVRWKDTISRQESTVLLSEALDVLQEFRYQN